MSLVSVFDAGHHELYHREKHLSTLIAALMSISEPRSFKAAYNEDSLKSVSCVWFFGPRNDINEENAKALHAFIKKGGSVIILADNLPPQFSAFIKKYGVTIGESTISPAYINYVDPHHVTIQHGVLNRSITEFIKSDPTFAYPNGSTLDVSSPSIPILSSGLSSYPLNMPVLGHYRNESKGSLTVIGSPHIFSDEWFKKESNEKLFKFIVSLVITKKTELNKIDAEHPELTERWYTPDVMSMSERLRSCIQESEKMKSDFVDNFDKGLFKMDMSHVADSADLANTLGLKNEPLEIVSPVFDTALPSLTPAVFPPQMREPSGPVLELFDLNDTFASPATRLAQLAQRTSPKNAEKFVVQAAKILGITQKLPEGKKGGKDILEYVFQQVVKWKRQSLD